MADNLIFPIGFDLDKAVEQAGKDWDGKFADKLEKLIAKKPVNVKLKLDTRNLDSLDAVKKRLAELKIEPITSETKSAIRELTSELRQLAKALETLQKYSKNPTKGALDTSRVQLNEKRAEAQAALAAQRAAKAEDNLAAARLKAARAANINAAATRSANKSFGEQKSYLNRLVTRIAAYWSVRQIGNFITNVREVTAQFELQRVSLGAIIQDQQRANQLFAEIKSFALTSPLKIMDLTKYTKQVAAYGIETKKLFGTTKMLADVSVGLGVSLDRLALFYGQVFATGYLRASEVRQATEAGIPLVDKLAKKLSDANGKLVSAADVMDLISKRAISFEQVEDVFQDMTSVGGEFYNMQVKQSQTLFGMWSKLGDAAALMYDQIGNTEDVNDGMKMLIRSLELMMHNWKTTAMVLDTVATSVAVYVIGIKSAAIASKALTMVEAARLAITNSQVIATPRLVAAIIGQNAATSLSTTLTRAHTVAMINQSVATNVLTRRFWGLTAALLANPWIAVAAAIAGVTAAIIHFTGNAETAADRAEKLNNSVASLKNIDDTTKPLVDTYNELIKKTERTAEEQKKLSEVTHELAKQYPGAITAIGNFGTEVELAADKLNQLYQVEKQARMDNTRNELYETEKKIKEVEAEIEKYQQQLASGEKTIYKRLGDSGLRTKKVVPLTEEDKGDILKMIDELRYGEDGQSGLLGLQQSAEAARRALGLIPSEAAQAVEKFGAWKKTLTTFRQQVGNVRVQLFDDSAITQFGSLEEALKKTAEEYKKNIALVATYDSVLKSSVINSEERAKIETERAEADTMATLAKNALQYYNALSLIDDKNKRNGGIQSDPRLGILKEMVSTLKQVNKEYDDLQKKEGNTRALKDTQKVYANTFKNMQALARQYKFELPNFGVPTDTASLTKYLEAIKKSMAKLPKSQKAVLALQVDIDKLNIDEKQKQIEEELKRLADRVSRTKAAQEFYDKILSTTGDIELAASVTMSIYGDAGTDVQGQMANYISELFGKYDIQVPVDIVSEAGEIDYTAMEKYVRENEKILGDGYKELLKIAQDGQKDMAKTYEGYLKDLEVAKTYADKRIELARDTANKINEIERERVAAQKKLDELVASGKTDKDTQSEIKRLEANIKAYSELPKQYEERENREAAKLEYEAFKDTPLYVQMFEDLDYASTSALTRMRDRLVALKDQWKNLDPTQLKELQKRLEEIESQLAIRNPFKILAESFKKWRKLKDSGRTSKSDEEAADAAEIARVAAWEKMMADERAYQAAVKESGAMSDAARSARSIADSSKEQYESAEKTAKETAESVHEWVDMYALISKSVSKISEYQSNINEAASGVRMMMEAFGASDEDLEFFDELIGGFNKVAEGGKQAGLAALSFMSGDIFGGITKSISAVGSIISGFTDIIYAGRIRRANKEIKRQQELLDQLEYTYGRLEKSAEKVFGADFVKNQRLQYNILLAQQKAYMKQYDAEMSKGKKADDKKAQEYLDKAREIGDQIVDIEGKISERMLGTDITSAARDFAQAWLDAYKQFGNTADAMSEKFHEMIENMVVESLMAKAMQRALEPTFKMIDDMDEGDFYNEDFWRKVMDSAEKGSKDANAAGAVIMEWAKKWGYDGREKSEGFTGIAKNVAGATSEEINSVAAIGNTLMYYVSPIPRIDENLVVIRSILEGGNRGNLMAVTTTGWTDWQQQAMDNYNAIARNTAETVAECRRSAQACENIAAQFSRIIKSKGSITGVNTFLSN